MAGCHTTTTTGHKQHKEVLTACQVFCLPINYPTVRMPMAGGAQVTPASRKMHYHEDVMTVTWQHSVKLPLDWWEQSHVSGSCQKCLSNWEHQRRLTLPQPGTGKSQSTASPVTFPDWHIAPSARRQIYVLRTSVICLHLWHVIAFGTGQPLSTQRGCCCPSRTAA